jgi:ribonuclease HII
MLQKCFDKSKVEAGCDEAGRGCLAGPVTAAAVILPKRFSHPLLNDSKKMTEANRILLRKVIEEKALAFFVTHLSHEEIDKINILNASIKAMQLSLDRLDMPFDFILVDGNRFKPYKNIPYECIVKGDAKFMSIAAASVLAKTYRDDFMNDLHQEFPVYAWHENKGYPTAKHRAAIAKFGPSPYHRMTFNLLGDRQLELF